LHGSFEEKNWSKLFVWDPCCALAAPIFICVILSTLPTWPSVSSHPHLRFQYDYGSTKETCENFARLIENNTWSREESLTSLLEGYKPRDVYNADQTGLFFNVLPERTLAYKGETCHGGKHSKDRLTVLLCVNSVGSDKQVPTVIRKSSKPRCFKDGKKLPIKYNANSKAWITTDFLVRSSIL
jgi:hypothetical protein